MPTIRFSNRQVAAAWLLGGAAWVVAGLVDEGVHEPIWLVADACLLAGLLGLRAQRLLPTGSRGCIGLTVAIAGRVIFIAAELVAAIVDADDNPLLPLGALLTAVGMLLFGVALVRTERWPAPERFAPLAMGLYPFLVMFPYVALHDGEPSVAAIAWWGVTPVAIGVALLRTATTTHASRRTAEVPTS